MKVLNKIWEIVVLILLALVTLVLSILFYIKQLWVGADYEQIMVTLRDITPDIILDNTFAMDYVYGLLFWVVVFPLCYYFLNVKKQIIVLGIFTFLIAFFSGFISYEFYGRTESNLYEEEYVRPLDVEYKFPLKKRNLLLIYMESFEQGFANEKYYGANIIPDMSMMQKQGEYSVWHKNLPGANYSVAALVASQCGLPLRFRKDADMWYANFFLPKVNCFPEILKKNGYQTMIIKAADITFTNVDKFAKQHGYAEALGVDEIRKDIGDENWEDKIGTFGGVRDRVLFEYAKGKFEQFDKDKPFMLTLFSLDTHTPSPFYDKECKREFGDMRDVVKCSNKAVVEFVEWFKTTPYWENTTVIVVGDHLFPFRFKGQEKDKKRGIYNVFLNLPEGLKIEKNKIFTTYDLAPSILESLGIEMNPRAFGLGRSMFYSEPSLVEKLGLGQLRVRLIQKSKVYEEFYEPSVKRIDKYKEYTLGDEILNNQFSEYTDVFFEMLGRYYIDRVGLKLLGYKGGDLKAFIKFRAVMGYKVNLIVSVNGIEVRNFELDPEQKQPISLEFDIPKEMIKDEKIILRLRNTSGTGISPDSLRIIEK